MKNVILTLGISVLIAFTGMATGEEIREAPLSWQQAALTDGGAE